MFYELAEKTLALERQGKKIMRLNVGDTNLPTPKCAIEAAQSELRKGKPGYGSSAGMPELIEKIAEREKCTQESVVVGPGSKHLLFALLSVLPRKGGTLAFPSPHWPAYELAARQLGLKARPVKTSLKQKWGFNAKGFDGADAVIVCNPLNPTSTIYSEKSISELTEKCAEKNVPLIIDEAYRGLAFKKIPVQESAIRVRSFSKEFSMEGWRLGYAIAPKELAKKIIAFNQITMTCVPAFVQAGGIACLDEEKKILSAHRKTWQERASAASRALTRAGFGFSIPEAGIYVFATHENIQDSEKFCMQLLEKQGIVVAPGTGFGDYNNFIRLCLNQETEKMKEAIERIANTI